MYDIIRLLLEDDRKVETELEKHPEALAWLKQHAPRGLEYYIRTGNARLYRGFGSSKRDTSKPQIVQPSGYRPARNTSDAYKMWLDATNPNWPRRGYSTVCSTDWHYALQYSKGKPSAIIPKDNTIVAWVGKEDMHDTKAMVLHFSALQRLLFSLVEEVGGPQSFLTFIVNFSTDLRELMRNWGRVGAPKSRTDRSMEQLDNSIAEFQLALEQAIQQWPADSSRTAFRKLEGGGGDSPLANLAESLMKTWLVDRKIVTDFSRRVIASKIYSYENMSSFGKAPASELYSSDQDLGECWFEGPYALLPEPDESDITDDD